MLSYQVLKTEFNLSVALYECVQCLNYLSLNLVILFQGRTEKLVVKVYQQKCVNVSYVADVCQRESCISLSHF